MKHGVEVIIDYCLLHIAASKQYRMTKLVPIFGRVILIKLETRIYFKRQDHQVMSLFYQATFSVQSQRELIDRRTIQ